MGPASSLGAPPARAGRAEPPTSVLIERAVARGEISRQTGDLYLARSLGPDWDEVPPAYRSDSPWHGTLPLLRLRQRLESMAPGPARAELRAALHPGPSFSSCDVDMGGPDAIDSAFFHIHYNDLTIGGGLDVSDYATSLDTAWTKEVSVFGWAAPPLPGGATRYPVIIAALGPGLYGFVAPTGVVGNNPNTTWNEGDAETSCMALNENYTGFPSLPQASLDATTAHEFNHSIQFGYGALAGANVADDVFIEGGATWMEDEVFDGSNDNYNYLWPVFEDDMGQYIDGPTDSPYEYWVTFRGMSEPYGTGVAGGGEDIMQRFWELTSQPPPAMASNLEAMDMALEAKGTSLGLAYHAYAIAVKFAKACGGGYQYPHCLEEGPAYVVAAGPTPTHAVAQLNAMYQGSLPDNYSLNWISLPGNTEFQVSLQNTSSGGQFRASVVCDTGAGLVITPFDILADAGETAFARDLAPCASPFAVVTNVAQTAPNPPSSDQRTYLLLAGPPAVPSNLTLTGKVTGGFVVAKGKLTPTGGSPTVEVTLSRKDGRWKEVKTRQAFVGASGKFRYDFKQPNAKKCRVEAEFDGDLTRLPSKAKRTFSC